MLYPFLNEIKSNGKPAVLVTVYGIIGEGVALNELQTIMENSGFKAVAAGSFIGEHSFSTKELPIAEGRPNQCDLQKAQNFGQNIVNKLKTIDNINKSSLSIPQGKLPLMAKILPKNSASMFTATPYSDMSICNQCGVCAKLCPVSAIDKNTLIINDNLCLRCFCCVKRCNRKARKIVYKKKFFVVRVLNAKGKVKKEPEIYL
jgi:ferredoxin